MPLSTVLGAFYMYKFPEWTGLSPLVFLHSNQLLVLENSQVLTVPEPKAKINFWKKNNVSWRKQNKTKQKSKEDSNYFNILLVYIGSFSRKCNHFFHFYNLNSFFHFYLLTHERLKWITRSGISAPRVQEKATVRGAIKTSNKKKLHI